MRMTRQDVLTEIHRQRAEGIQPTSTTLSQKLGTQDVTILYHIKNMVYRNEVYFDERHMILLDPSEIILSKTQKQIIELEKEHGANIGKIANLLGTSRAAVNSARKMIAKKTAARDLRVAELATV